MSSRICCGMCMTPCDECGAFLCSSLGHRQYSTKYAAASFLCMTCEALRDRLAPIIAFVESLPANGSFTRTQLRTLVMAHRTGP